MKTALAIFLMLAPLVFAARLYPNAGSYRSFAINAIADPGTNITISFWYYPTTNSAAVYRSLVLIRDTSTGLSGKYSGVWAIPGNFVAAYDLLSGAQASTATAMAETNQWIHIGMTKAGDANRVIWKDGIAKATNTTSLTNASSRTNVLIGTDIGTGGSASYPPSGRIAEVAIWSVTLSASEMASIASGISPLRVRPAALVFYSPMHDDGATSANLIGSSVTHSNATIIDHPPIYR